MKTTITLSQYNWYERIWIRCVLAYYAFTVGANDRITITDPE